MPATSPTLSPTLSATTAGLRGIVFGDADFDLADQVGGDIGCLGVDAAASFGQQRQGRRAEAEAEHDFRVSGQQEDEAHADDGETHHRQAHHGAGIEGHLKGPGMPCLAAVAVRTLAATATVMPI